MPRPYGTGRVYKRGGRWQIEYGVNGERIRKTCGHFVKTKKEALAILREAQSAADRGYTPSRALVSDLLDFYKEEHKRLGRKDKGVYTKLEVLRAGLGKYKACELTVRHIERWQRWMKENRGVGGTTLNRYGAMLSRAYRIAEARGMRFAKPHWPKFTEKRRRNAVIPEDVYEAMLAELPEPYKTITVAGWWTGCRLGEILRWRWSDVRFDDSVVQLPDTKSGEPRTVPLGKALSDALLLLNMRGNPSACVQAPVFSTDGIRPITVNQFEHRWQQARKRIGQPGIVFHGLRHTAITRMREAGVSEGVIMAITGHKTRAVFDGYGEQPESKLREAVELVEGLSKREDAPRRVM